MRYDQHAIVPARGGLLTHEGALPAVTDEWRVEALMAILPPTRFLRTAAHAEVEPEHALRLRVFEAVDEPGTPIAEIDPPRALRPAFDRCVAELRGAPVPARRAAWARPGWHEQAEAWAGMPLEQFRSWPLSAVLRNADVYFKAVFPLFRHETAVTEALGAPRLLQVDHDRGWMLMEAVAGVEEEDHHAAMRALAAVHREWSSRVGEALALGAPDRRAPSVLPHTLVHGDFHAGNIGGSTIIDWSDAAVADPLHDLNHYLLHRAEQERADLLETYAEAWPGYDVPSAAAAAEAETYEYVALSYAHITDALADDDRWWFSGEEARWLQRASDVRAGRRPSPDT